MYARTPSQVSRVRIYFPAADPSNSTGQMSASAQKRGSDPFRRDKTDQRRCYAPTATYMNLDRADEIMRHFDVVAVSLRSEFRTVAEGFVATNERIDRLETVMSGRFGELEAMIRLSFSELARRIS